MIETTIKIRGMHCRSCELLIEDAFKEINGVKSVHANTKNKNVTVLSEDKLGESLIYNTVRNAGYDVGSDDIPFISKNISDYRDLVLAGIALVVLYLIARYFGIDRLVSQNNSRGSNLLVVFTVGITAGLSTCMAMVGGLILGVSARHAEKHPEATSIQKFRPHLFFNLGRVASYIILGGVIGQIGSVFRLGGSTLGYIMIMVGLVMLFLGVQLIEIFSKFSSGITLPKFVTKLFKIKHREQKEYSHINALIVGALTFFLPCGFTQAMQIYAISTGNFLSGALIMGVFALGTTPGLLGIGGLTSYIKKGYFSRLFFKFVGLLVIALSLFNISNGLNLTGLRAVFARPVIVNENDPNVKNEDGVQTVKMEQTTYGYNPNKFSITVGVPVKWVINSKDSFSCASSLVVPKLNIQKTLREGENIIEFTPDKVGRIMFSCFMGMYNGFFDVTESGGEATKEEETSADSNTYPNQPQGIKPNVGKSSPPPAPLSPSLQYFKAAYSISENIQPNIFNVKAGKPVRVEIEAKEDGVGCMSSVFIPGISNDIQIFEKGKTVVFEFTPSQRGKFPITCAMGVPFGDIVVS